MFGCNRNMSSSEPKQKPYAAKAKRRFRKAGTFMIICCCLMILWCFCLHPRATFQDGSFTVHTPLGVAGPFVALASLVIIISWWASKEFRVIGVKDTNPAPEEPSKNITLRDILVLAEDFLTCISLMVVVLWLMTGNLPQRSQLGQDKVLLENIDNLTFFPGSTSVSRRGTHVDQTICLGGPGDSCSEVSVTMVRAMRAGKNPDGTPRWLFAVLISDAEPVWRFDNMQVRCEGYDSDDDVFVLRGSCRFEYELVRDETVAWQPYAGLMVSAFG